MTSQPTSGDFAEALAATSVIVTVSMTAWHPSKTDRRLREDVAEANAASAGAFSVRKSLLAGADAPFRAISTLQQNLRLWINQQTVPFGVTTTTRTQGPRLLANHLIVPFTEHIEQQRQALANLVKDACASYGMAVASAELNLGDAFDANDYPDVSTLARLFDIKMEISPVPSAAAFKRIGGMAGSAALHDSLSARLEDTLAEKAAVARADLEERAQDALQRINDRLSALKAWTEAGGEASGERRPAQYQSMHDEAHGIAQTIHAYASSIGMTPTMQTAADVLAKVGALTPEAIAKSDATLDSTLTAARQAFACF
jgi:hypothetical protein